VEKTDRRERPIAYRCSVCIDESLPILVVEDDQDDYLALERMLRNVVGVNLERTTSVSQAKSLLADGNFKVVILDLNLPDSCGMDTVVSLCKAPEVPVIVLSGVDEEGMALNAVKHGAQDYLVKDTLNPTLLIKTIRYSVERYKLVRALEDSKSQTQREKELARQQTSIPSLDTTITADSFGLYPLRESNLELFNTTLAMYQAILEHAMEQRVFKVQHDVSNELQNLATLMGSHGATPRDVIDLHSTTLASKTATVSSKKSNVYNEEGRYLLIGILGYLCTFYSTRCHPRTFGKAQGHFNSVSGDSLT